MKEALRVDLDGFIVDVELVDDNATGVVPIYETPEPLEDGTQPKDILVGYMIYERCKEGLHKPKFDFNAWEEYNRPPIQKVDENGDLMFDENGNPIYEPKPIVEFWVEGKSLDLEEYKKKKIAEFSKICEQEILSDFECDALGYVQHYGYDEIDQRNLQLIALDLLLNPSIPTVLWKTKESVEMVEHTREQFMQVLATASNHQKSAQYKYLQLKYQILQATTKEEIDAIVW